MLAHFSQAFARHPVWILISLVLIIAWLWPEVRRGWVQYRNRRVLRDAEKAARKRWEGHRRE
jgi:hypothetical protein